MKAYDRIYNALVEGREPEWKEQVDELIAKYRAKGQTPTQAVKSAAMELNIEKEDLDVVEGFFLKAYKTRQGQTLFNTVLEGEVCVVTANGEYDLPEHPSAIKITAVSRVKNLMSHKTHLELTKKTKISISPLDPDDLVDAATTISCVPDDTFALISGTMEEVTVWKEPMVTPESVNLKLWFRTDDLRTGFFVSSFEQLLTLMPSRDDETKLKELIDNAEWEDALAYINEVAGRNREFDIPGLEVLVYGKIKDNPWTDRDGNERMGKNIRVGIGGFIYSLDYLYDLSSDKSPSKPEKKSEKPKKQKTLEPEPDEDDEPEEKEAPAADEDEDDEPVEEADIEVEPQDEPIEVPEGGSVDDAILKALEGAKNGLNPQELVERVGVSPTEIATKLNELIELKKVELKDGKFVLKKKR